MTIAHASARTLAALSLLFLFSCAVNPVTGERELMLLSESQEVAIGREAGPSLNWTYGGEFHDPQLKGYLEGIVRKIWANSERPHLPMQFAIQNTSLPNAFALPGYVAITRGLLAELDNEAQFAAVMGHEVGHVMARHTAKRVTSGSLQQMGLVLGGVVLGDREGADALLTIGAVGSSLLLLKFDREQELQSDRLGVKYMADLGYDPREAIGAHERLSAAVDGYLKRQGKERRNDTLLDAILSTHPRHEVRTEEMLTMIAKLPPYRRVGDGRFRERFQSARERLREINEVYFLYDRALMLYNEDDLSGAGELISRARLRSPEEAPFHNLAGMIALKRQDYGRATTLFQEALRRDRGYQPSVFGLGLVALMTERYQDATVRFRESLQLYPDHPGSHFGLGKSLFALGNCGDALAPLRRFAASAPDHPEVHGMLGICYERAGDVRSAIAAYERQLRLEPHTALGRHARQRLSILKQPPPGRG